MSLFDVIGWTGLTISLTGACLKLAAIRYPSPEREHAADGVYAVGAWLVFVAYVIASSPVWAVIFGCIAAYYTWKWWKNRRKGRGKKALRELGDKSRRRVQALVDRMTPSPASPTGASA